MSIRAEQILLPAAATAAPWVPLNTFATPMMFSVQVAKIGGGEVSANVIWTASDLYNPAVVPVASRLAGLEVTVGFEDTTAIGTAFSFAASGVRLQVASVSGSAAFTFNVLQAG